MPPGMPVPPVRIRCVICQRVINDHASALICSTSLRYTQGQHRIWCLISPVPWDLPGSEACCWPKLIYSTSCSCAALQYPALWEPQVSPGYSSGWQQWGQQGTQQSLCILTTPLPKQERWISCNTFPPPAWGQELFRDRQGDFVSHAMWPMSEGQVQVIQMR